MEMDTGEVFAISEDALDDDDILNQIRLCLADDTKRGQVRLAFAGERELGSLLTENVPLGERQLVYLGPNYERLKPLWLWAWGVQASEPNRLTLNIPSREGALSQGFELFLAWHYVMDCNARRSLDFPNALRRISLLIQSNLEKTPEVAKVPMVDLGEFFLRIAEFFSKVFLSINSVSWKDATKLSGPLRIAANTRIQAALNNAVKACGHLKKTYGHDTIIPMLDLCRTLFELGSDEVGDDRKTWLKRLPVWSALVFARADQLKDAGLLDLAFVGYWRAFEIMLNKVALEASIIAIDGVGKVQWGSKGPIHLRQAGNEKDRPSAKPPTAYLIQGELENQGLRVGPPSDERNREGSSISELRIIRNNQLWTHGIAGIDNEALAHARSLVVATIGNSFEKPTSHGEWYRLVQQFGDFGNVVSAPSVLLRVIGVFR